MQQLPWPWRQTIWVLLAFCLPLGGFVHVLRNPEAERWEPVDGLPAAGAVRQIVSGQADGRMALYAVVERWGIFRSLDGADWLPANLLPRAPDGRLSPGPLALAPNNTELLLLGLAGQAAGGWPALYKTYDGGRSWLARRGLGAQDIEALTMAPGGVAYAVSSGELFRSADYGDTWLWMGRLPAGSRILSLAVDRAGGALYAGTEGSGIWLTGDGAWSWSTSLPDRAVSAIAFSQEGHIYAGTETGLHYSTDHGASWQALSSLPATGPVAALVVRPGSPDCIFVAPAHGPLEFSVDGGATWQSLQHLPPTLTVTALAVDPWSPRHLFVGTDRGLWRCTLPAQR